MKTAVLIVALLTGLLSGCDDKQVAKPPPHTLTADAVGKYCGMMLLEHAGPKGQIILASASAPVWFSSARDAIAFTLLPEEAKDIRAIYVSDMAKAPDWANPGVSNWVEARSAVFVIGSSMRGGMGGEETVPFSDPAAAERFAAEYGGRAVAFADVPPDYVLGSGESSGPPGAGTAGSASGTAHSSGHGH
jgi:copper chaperone NosL